MSLDFWVSWLGCKERSRLKENGSHFNKTEIIKKMDVTVAGEQDDDRYPWVIHSVLLDQEGRPKYLKR